MRNIYDSISKHICFVFKAYMFCKQEQAGMEYLCKSIIPTNAVSSVSDW